MRRLGLCAFFLAAGGTGCHSCGDRPRLLDRLFHRDDDGPSSRSSRDADCDRRGPLLGAPVSYSAPIAPAGPAFGIDAVPEAAAPANELPSPQYISPPNTPVPMGPGSGR